MKKLYRHIHTITVLQATPKAEVALKSGRLLTPSQDSLCGVKLQPRETYVITGIKLRHKVFRKFY